MRSAMQVAMTAFEYGRDLAASFAPREARQLRALGAFGRFADAAFVEVMVSKRE